MMKIFHECKFYFDCYVCKFSLKKYTINQNNQSIQLIDVVGQREKHAVN